MAKLEDFRLLSYKEREVLQHALMYYRHREDDIKLLGHQEALDALERRVSETMCGPAGSGCSFCDPDYRWEDYHDVD